MDITLKPPNSLSRPLFVPQKLLMGPGPTNSSPRVLKAMGLPILGHMHKECINVMDEIKEGLQFVFQTKNPVTLAISSSGHGGMEAAMCNLIEPGDTVLIAVNGIWGERASDIAHRYGAKVEILKKSPGKTFTVDELEKSIIKYKPILFFLTQGESSTGVYQALDGFGEICRRNNCLFVVDTVASLGAVPVFTDLWKIDVVYSGSQKVLGAPPGLAPISFSSQALNKVYARKSPISVFYWDITKLGNYWGCFDEARILPTVTTIRSPPEINTKHVSNYAMERYNVEISGGLGPSAGLVMRIGLMGYNANFSNVDTVLNVLQEAMEYAKHNKSKL
ncbi:Serine--pyruvate aminotransferase [Gryllus bimaculatus]|nr:Serine--pyruvate aminotransferase [Gryllus bimaculatus]